MSIPEHFRFVLLSVLCVIISAVSVIISVKTCTPGDAGLGGALGVALSFAALFLSGNYGSKVYELITITLPTIEKRLARPEQGKNETDNPNQGEAIETMKNKIAALQAQFKIERQGQLIQNQYLAAMSIISTLFWGFGEWGVRHYFEMIETCVALSRVSAFIS
jgi:hypothetical protein